NGIARWRGQANASIRGIWAAEIFRGNREQKARPVVCQRSCLSGQASKKQGVPSASQYIRPTGPEIHHLFAQSFARASA
ncbi:MAG: hypothetical protein ACK4Q5_01080, partial [Saprospiraceae bacterium]